MPGYELIDDEELKEINSLFNDSGILFRHSFDHLRNGVYKVDEFEKNFRHKMKVPYALGVTSGTAALRVALASLDIKEGDEIITQSFTFVATVEAIVEARAVPVITEIDKTLNMDPNDLIKKITKRTKAIIVVHMLGTPANLKEIKKIAEKYNIPIIEDTAWGCGGSYDGKSLGTYGKIGTYSFDFAKTLTTGEGGMIVFKDEDIFLKAKAWHDHGHENNPNLPRWEDSRSSSGFNFRMNEMQGAVGIAQLKKLEFVVKTQRKNALKIKETIQNLNLEFRHCPEKGYETSDSLIFFVDNNDIAKKCRDSLLVNGIGTKILPEAITWHFAGTWEHINELKNKHHSDLYNSFLTSKSILEKSVSIPISLKMIGNFEGKIYDAISKVLK